MHEYGTTSEQLAWVKVAASHHAQHNPHAMLRDVVTVEEIVKQMLRATAWLHRIGSRYGAFGNSLYIAGHSAGGHLSSLLGTSGGVKEFDVGDQLIESSNLDLLANSLGALAGATLAAPFASALIIYGLTLVLELFVTSGSGKALLVIPILMPLAMKGFWGS